MRRLLTSCAAAILLTACGQAERSGRETTEASPSGAVAEAPNIGVTAAPGVAFNYRYAFRLDDAKIASAQEQHAQACERLGVARCRITGMRYTVVDTDSVQAMLAFKLDPAIARGFGRAAVSVVQAADGKLVDAEITGEDAAAAIVAADKSAAGAELERARIEARLAQKGVSNVERARLASGLTELRTVQRASTAEREARQESLAVTPMTLEYASDDLVSDFNPRSPVRSALAQSIENLVSGVAIIFLILVTVLPWAIAGGLLWIAGRWVRRRWFRRPAGEV
jgi:hypothetical protein